MLIWPLLKRTKKQEHVKKRTFGGRVGSNALCGYAPEPEEFSMNDLRGEIRLEESPSMCGPGKRLHGSRFRIGDFRIADSSANRRVGFCPTVVCRNFGEPLPVRTMILRINFALTSFAANLRERPANRASLYSCRLSDRFCVDNKLGSIKISFFKLLWHVVISLSQPKICGSSGRWWPGGAGGGQQVSSSRKPGEQLDRSAQSCERIRRANERITHVLRSLSSNKHALRHIIARRQIMAQD